MDDKQLNPLQEKIHVQKQPLEKLPQQHKIDAYGGIEAGTSQFESERNN